MNQFKFTLADLLTALASIGFGFLTFLSFNFLTLGDTKLSILAASLIGFVLGGLALGAKLLKQTTRNFKTSIIWEWILLLLFVVSAFLSVYPFSHYFIVSDKKEIVQQKVSSDIAQAEGIFSAYESYSNNRIDIYKNQLRSIVAAKKARPSEYHDYGFVDGTDDNTQIENKVFTLTTQLFPSNYTEMKMVDSTWLSDSKAKILNWSPIGIVTVINTINIETASWINQLIAYSSFRAQGEISGDFNYPLTLIDESKFFTENASPTILSITYAIVFYILMLFSYFVTKRHTRYPGLKLVFGFGSAKENEL